jgi:hypothetical protein
VAGSAHFDRVVGDSRLVRSPFCPASQREKNKCRRLLDPLYRRNGGGIVVVWALNLKIVDGPV